jgi:hypothetical protein
VILFAQLAAWLTARRSRVRGDRGDVPGWVMVCVMTAILVVAILGVFEPEIKGALSGVIDSVSGK